MSSKTARAASALKSGVVLGGTAILSAMNGITPHMAGAVDIMVVEQPDGTLKCSPFYVRFGKYTPLRTKDKVVKIVVNGEEASFAMHLGAYGQAYFAAETSEIVSDQDEDDEILSGMMSPPSGYSSGDEGTPYANADILSAVKQEVEKLKNAHNTAAADVLPSTIPSSAQRGAGSASTQAQPLQQFTQPSAPVARLPARTSIDSTSSSSLSEGTPTPADVQQAVLAGVRLAGSNPEPAASDATALVEPAEGPPAVKPELESSAATAAVQETLQEAQEQRPLIQLESAAVDEHMLKKGEALIKANGLTQDQEDDRPFDHLLLDSEYSMVAVSGDSFSQFQPLKPSPTKTGAVGGNSKAWHQQQQQQQHHHQQQQGVTSTTLPTRHVGFDPKPALAVSSSKPPLPPSMHHTEQQSHAVDGTSSASHDNTSAQTDSQHRQGSHMADTSADSTQSQVGSHSSFASASQQPSNDVAPDTVTGKTLHGLKYDWSEYEPSQPSIQEVDDDDEDDDEVLSPYRPIGSSQQKSVDSAAAPISATTGPAAEQHSLTSTAPAAPDELLCPTVSLAGGIAVKTASDSKVAQQVSTAEPALDAPTADQSVLPTADRSTASGSASVDVQEEPMLLQQAAAEDTQQLSRMPNADATISASLRPDAANGSLPTTRAGSVAEEASTIRPPSTSSTTPPGLLSTHLAARMDGTASRYATCQDGDALPSPLDIEAAAQAAVQTALQPAQADSLPSQPAPVPPPADSTPASALPSSSGTAMPTSAAPIPSIRAPLNQHDLDDPLSMSPPPFGASPGDGYLGDVERGPLSAQPPTPGTSGQMPLALQSFQLSTCGHLLTKDTPPADVHQLFEAHKVSPAQFAEKGAALLADDTLICRVGGSLYPWSVAAPLLVGMLAFGGSWDQLVPEDPEALFPLKLDVARMSTPKKGASSSSWRLWPFSGWRDAAPAKSSLPNAKSPPSSSSPAPPSIQKSASDIANYDSKQSSAGTSPRASMLKSEEAAQLSRASAPPMLRGHSFTSTLGLSGPNSLALTSPPARKRKKHIIIIRKTLIPLSEHLASLPLKYGSNTIVFRATGVAELHAYIYLLRWNTRLVISDVDGTITKSDLLGHVLPPLGVDWSHAGITQLFHNIVQNGYEIMYLSARAIGQANITRDYLHTLVQNGYKMPSGPVIISPHGLLPSLYREIVQRRPHEFKIACLQDIRALFPSDWNPFYAGFGNRDTDVVSYREVGVPLGRTFTINPKGQIQKASTAVQSSTWSSLSAINDLVHEMFPAIHTGITRSLSVTIRSAARASSKRNRGDDVTPDGLAPVGEEEGGALVVAPSRERGGVAALPRLEDDEIQRDEFNDVQYWRPTLSVNIDDELKSLEPGPSPGRSAQGSFVA